MNVKIVLCVVGLVGLSVTCGCQSLCPEGEKLAAANDSKGAIRAYMSCWSQTKPGSEGRGEIERKVKELAEPIVRPLVARWDSQAPTTLLQYDQAINELEEVRPYDEPGGPFGVAKKIDSYKDRRQKLEEEIRELLRKANEQRREQQWTPAMESVAGAIDRHPERSDARALRERILTDRDAYYGTEIGQSCRAKDWQRATNLLKDFAAEQPQPPAERIQALRKQVQETKDAEIRAFAEKAIGERRYFEAYTRIDEAQADCPDLRETIRERGWRHYVETANRMLDDVRYFHAYVAAVKAMSLPKSPRTPSEDPEQIAFELHRQCSDLMNDSIQVEICVAAFDSPASDAAVGKEFADRLVNDLHSLLPYGLHLDDRRRVEYAVAERAANVRDGLQLVGVSWAVQGSLSMTCVKDRQESEQLRWVTIKQTVRNPDYDTQLIAYEKEYGKEPSRWPRQPSRTITDDLTERITYKSGVERMEGEISVSANVYSAAQGSITESKSFRVSRTEKDSFGGGVEQAGIEADPLDIKSEQQFKQELEEAMRKEVVAWLLGCFCARQQKFCEEAGYHLERREWDQAVRAAAQGYFYCLKDNVPADDEWFVKLRRLALFELTELPRPEGPNP